jgi:D-ribose pyranose/furanose isomerase RbsD
MKRGGILNAQLAGALARLGHTDTLVVCDAGLPIPPGSEVVDLAVTVRCSELRDHTLTAVFMRIELGSRSRSGRTIPQRLGA